MGELLPPVPTTPNNVTDSWAPLVDSNVMSSYGMNVVTLTNWDATTTRPEIAQGSVIEIDGSLATFDTQEELGNLNPPDGDVYVKFTVTGYTVEARLTGTVPHWDNTKGGWYNASGERYSGHVMTKNGTAYTAKQFKNRPTLVNNIIYSTGIQTTTGEWIVPISEIGFIRLEKLYAFKNTTGDPTANSYLEFFDGTEWLTFEGYASGGPTAVFEVIHHVGLSNGSNYRLRMISDLQGAPGAIEFEGRIYLSSQLEMVGGSM